MKIFIMKKLLNNNIIVLFILSSLGTGCRKDSPIPKPLVNITDTTTVNCDTCITCADFPPPGELGYGYVQDGTQYFKPCFNPNNENEFIYIRKNTPTVTELVKYNLNTNTETIICDTEYIISQPQWGKTGWIIFNLINKRIYKIDDNGNNLTQVTFHESTYPKFDADGTSIICMNQYPNLTTDYRPIIDLNGQLIDSVLYRFGQIYTGYSYSSVNSNFQKGYFRFADHSNGSPPRQGFCFYENNSIQEVSSIYPKYSLTSMTKVYSSILFTEYWNNLYKIDLVTNTTSIFLEGCQTKYYDHLSISPNGNEMLVEKIINTSTVYEFGDVDINEKHEIWLINLNDKTETKILGQ